MPLLPGKKNIGHNIKTEENAGKSKKQSIAIALNVARESGANIPKQKKNRLQMKAQTKKDKMDESLGMKHGKESKHKETMKDRRHESAAMKKKGK